MRYLYTLLLYLLLPLVLLRLWWRGRRAPAYRRRWRERFGFMPRLPVNPVVWVHAVSVGETVAAVPLIRWLRARGEPVLVTTTTPTGSERVRAVFGEEVFHVYCPYDLPAAVRRFLARTQPKLALIMETELWPNLFHGCARAGVPVVVANARLSQRSAAGYRKVAALTRATLAQVSLIAAQTDDDAERLRALGGARVEVTGSVKFDISIDAELSAQGQSLRHAWGVARPVWIAASTHAGEDEQVLAAHAELLRVLPHALLVLVPRHPERFDEVAALCGQRSFNVVRRSTGAACETQTQVLVGDTMGELLVFFAAGDAAFVGGSLVPTGGHNVLEPAALGLPVAVGPHTFNFLDITARLIARNGAVRVHDATELAALMQRWLSDATERARVGQAGAALVEQNRGALARLQGLLEAYL